MTITIMVVTTQIQRYEADIALKGKHILIYGRRKVGKTFLVKNYLSHDIYVLAKRGGGFYLENAPLRTIDSYDQFTDMLKGWLKEGKTVAIDEIQRMPMGFFEAFQHYPDKGRVILTGSSFHIVKDIISQSSPILGLVGDLKLSLISPIIARIALSFTSVTYFLIGVFGLSIIAYIIHGSFLKGLIS